MRGYMPQYHNGECWNDVWFSPCDYSRAKSIRDMFLRDPAIPRTSLRIIAII